MSAPNGDGSDESTRPGDQQMTRGEIGLQDPHRIRKDSSWYEHLIATREEPLNEAVPEYS